MYVTILKQLNPLTQKPAPYCVSHTLRYFLPEFLETKGHCLTGLAISGPAPFWCIPPTVMGVTFLK